MPTFREAGVAGMDGQGWFGLFLPAATPRAVVDKYAAEVNRILAQPELRKRMGEMGIVLTGSTPDAFAQTVRTDYARWGKVIRVNNIRLD
ncbi:Tripartite tricarboxylate transporter family receptor [compost metagenome]